MYVCMYVWVHIFTCKCVCIYAYVHTLQYRILIGELPSTLPHRAERRSAKVNPTETGCEDRGQGWTLLVADSA